MVSNTPRDDAELLLRPADAGSRGIEPATPGFKTVRIAPHLGSLPNLQASYPQPEGMMAVEYLKRRGAWSQSDAA
jgi:hypothetical protein